ncbi:flagellar hook protein FlgE [Azotobacter salinestris]|uniref:flagellar hook protein FlgE n=1 Tax=Azotobacter salinestris TaxID=69964 RepID=UPI001266A569|nr:flagellar hook protein FlgE [Azotobacter salinestris]
MGFSQALSGLNAASTNLNVVSNNIANSQTVGFKSSITQFADIYAGAKVGLGTRVAAVVQNFNSGNLETTDRVLDLAISGSGFFRLEQGGQMVYSRNGQLTLTADGYLENAQGARLVGADGIIRIPAEGLRASPTSEVKATLNLDAGTDLVTVEFDSANPATYSYANAATVYDSLGNAHQLTTYYRKVDINQWEVHAALDGKDITPIAAPMVSFNSSGILQDSPVLEPIPADYEGADKYLTDNGYIDVQAYLDVRAAYEADPTNPAPPAISETDHPQFQQYVDDFLAYKDYRKSVEGPVVADYGNTQDYLDAKVAYEADPTQPNPDPIDATLYPEAQAYLDHLAAYNLGPVYKPAAFSISAAELNNGAATLSFQLDLTGTNQFGNDFEVSGLTQNGYTTGGLMGFSVDVNGNIVGKYSNEQTQILGQIQLASFRNPEGLQPVGDNVWIETAASGQALAGVAGAGQFGTIESGVVETSNVDLTKELVNLIIAQRNFQANAQSVKTQSDVLEQAVNLGR